MSNPKPAAGGPNSPQRGDVRVGQLVASLREARGLTQRQLSDRADNWSLRIESIELATRPIRVDNLAKLAAALNVGTAAFVDCYLGYPTQALDQLPPFRKVASDAGGSRPMGRQLRRARVDCHAWTAELRSRCDMSTTYINDLERGSVFRPQLRTIWRCSWPLASSDNEHRLLLAALIGVFAGERHPDPGEPPSVKLAGRASRLRRGHPRWSDGP